MKTTASKRRAAQNAAPRLERRLALVLWFADQLGYDSNDDMLADLKEAGEGWGDSRNRVLERILARVRPPKIAPDMLDRMDSNIRADLRAINERREKPIVLKYFQYLAALAAECFLERLADSKDRLVAELDSFVKRRNAEESGPPILPRFDSEHLGKLAFWMATGGGKTLLMHINLRQFMRRKNRLFAPKNIVLVTPNAEMTEQHLDELRASDIPCRRYDETSDMLAAPNAVCVVDINKFSDKPAKKKGVTISRDFFAGPNLVFVDEGHKGAGGDRGYFETRDRLARDGGFVFEYSATFGQALAAPARAGRAEEYARAIAFDYSYRHFHGDGYGKDFFVLNLSGDYEQDKSDMLMLGNLLAFFQQRLAFDRCREDLASFNVESPLLLLLGALVTGGDESKKSAIESSDQTDIVRIIGFLHRALIDNKWIEKTTAKIIGGDSGIRDDETGDDFFAGRFDFLVETFALDSAALCREMRRAVFHVDAPAALRFCPLKKTARKGGQGEIGLRAGESQPFFGLIYVGNAAKLRALVEKNLPAVEIFEDSLADPLFPCVKDSDSPVNLLVGAKKFMEGWSSWRVCGIGLLNVGRGEGPQIIQLFGRGVRLLGRGQSLRRSEFLPDRRPAPELASKLRLLETLNVFAIRAEFMAQFRKYLEREGVAWREIEICARRSPDLRLPVEGLQTPKTPDAKEFDELFFLAADRRVSAVVDFSSRATVAQGGELAFIAAAATERAFDSEFCARIDFDDLYLRLLERKAATERANLIVRREDLPAALARCKIRGGESFLARRDGPQQAAFAALCKYADNLRGLLQKQWQREKIKIAALRVDGEKRDPNLIDGYKIRLPESERELIERIRKLARDESFLRSEDGDVSRVYFDRHLYLPLLCDDLTHKGAKISPAGLNAGETRFVVALREYAKAAPIPQNAEIFLLRNQPIVGAGFFLDGGEMFYPDFVLWVKTPGKQRVVFLDPHGMTQAGHPEQNDKVNLFEWLAGLDFSARADAPTVEIDSFIVSPTKIDDLRRRFFAKGEEWGEEQFAARHILFLDDLECPQKNAAAFARILGFSSPPRANR